ncbi:MAG TPA: cysteine desulfurase family protein, partial [Candidatus Kapabacteria bacterium]|nr:cysteine desulfurase family protein [Candidatus Kapabacteria bacterium]
EARVALENARTEIGKTINAAPAEIIFTSGGTESINTAINGLAEKAGKGKNQIVTTKAEHQAVLETCAYLEKHGFEIRYASVDEFGKTSPEALAEVMTEQTALVAIMHANNEVATVNDLASLSEVAHKHGALFFTDAVQSYGKFPIGVKELGIDAMAFCAHKIYGPKGIGALYVKGGLLMEPLVHGGSQERNRRGGTESTGLAVGFQAAARAMQKNAKDILIRTARLKSYFTRALIDAIPGVIFNMHPADSLPHIINISFADAEKLDPEGIILGLDLKGIAVSNGAACTSGSLKPSHVLMAMGRSEHVAATSVRFSLGMNTTEEELDYTVKSLKEILTRMRG